MKQLHPHCPSILFSDGISSFFTSQPFSTRRLKQFLLVFLFLPLPVFSQVLIVDSTGADAVVYEKLYLHIDREFYAPGDDVWFKSYLVSGINHKPVPGFKNVYVQLIAGDGKVVDEQLLLSMNGVSNSDFHLPDTLASGQYTIRAYTKYLQNFEEESLFHQKISVSRTTDLPEVEVNKETRKAIDVSFLPEGGSLVMNAANYVAFKAIDESGKGIPVTGKVVDETGQEVAAFESTWMGMGMFLLMPQEGKKYIARIDGHPNLNFQLEDARMDGVALHYQDDGDDLQFILNRSFKSGGTRNLTLLASHKGEELFRESIEMKGFQHPVTVYKGFFPLGISKITLLDELDNILAERLVFVRMDNEKFLEIGSDKGEYYPREKIELKVQSLLDSAEDSIVTGLSLAVVNEDYFSRGGRMQTIESYLLLDSELKGPLEAPAACFTNEEGVSANEKLDLVMMVNGWRKYYWDDLNEYFGRPLAGWDDTGLTIEGKVTTLFGEKPISGGTVELGPFSGQFLILKDTTDEQGRFRFDRVYLKDSALVMVNAFNKKGRQNVEVSYEPAPLFDAAVSAVRLNRITRPVEEHDGYLESSFRRHLAEREFELEYGSILLGDVDVVEEYKTGPLITSTYGFSDREYTLSDKDKQYTDIIRYLEFEVPGIFVMYNDSVRMGTSNREPDYYVDDVGADVEIVKTIPMDEIVKIELFHPRTLIGLTNPSWESGVRRTAGAISILTTNRFGRFSDRFIRNINGRIVPRFQAFGQAREFYSPKYPLAEEDFPEKPDLRPTLYWEPFALPVGNSSDIEFHTSDMSGRYRVIAEGISSKGKIVRGSAVFEVLEDKELQ